MINSSLMAIAFLLVILLEPGVYAAAIKYSIDLDVTADSLAFQSAARVELKLQDARLKQGACLYLPMEDPVVAKAAQIHTLRGQDLRDRAARAAARIHWSDPELFDDKGSGYYELRKIADDGFLQLSYTLTLAGWRDNPGPLRFMSDFYPLVLQHCPDPQEKVLDLPRQLAEFQVRMNLPAGWSQLAPGQLSDKGWQHQGSAFHFILYQTGEVHETKLSGSRLRFLYQAKEFIHLEAPVIEILQHHRELLGGWPADEFILVESHEYEPVSTPGLIVVNRPQQPLMRILQEEVLHWDIWQLTLKLAEQWFGFAAQAARLEDIWLTQSLADSMGLMYLDQTHEYSNLFASLGHEDAYFQLHYRQTQDIVAASLSLMRPHNALIDDAMQSRPGNIDNSPLSFIRSSQALRILNQEMGRVDYRQLLRLLQVAAKNQALTPQRVYKILKESDFAKGAELAELLRNYWASDVWPDAKLERIESAAGGQKTRVVIGSNSPLLVPLDIEVQASGGRRQTKHIHAQEYAQGVEFDLPRAAITRVELDPGRDIYDSDRYNNSDQLPGLYFFPGNARTLVDDGYTVLWAPVLQKLPGHKLTLQLGWQMFRYLGSGLSGWLIYHPEENRAGFRFSYQQKIPSYAMTVNLDMAQDDDNTLTGERLTDLTLSRRPLRREWPWLDLLNRQRLRQTLGLAEAGHLTTTLALNLHTVRQQSCSSSLAVGQERSTWVPHSEFSYARSTGLLQIGCDWSVWKFQTRAFGGVSERQGLVPGGALFNPQAIEEGRLRLDRPLLPLSGRLASWGLDLLFPARLPLPSAFFVLPRRTQFKIFADQARLREPEHRAFASGLGLVLPIGGDVVGKQAVTLLEFSLLAVLHRRIDASADSRPGLLIDFSGRL